MKYPLNLIGAVAMGGMLAACTNSTSDIGRMSVKGGDYEKGLHQGYLKLAKDEHDESDWSDAVKFEDRAKLSAMGNPPSPELVSAREIPTVHKQALSDGYERLRLAMSQDAARKAGRHAAAAQTSFDCWMQEAEENLQPRHIAACRNDFYGSMALVEAAVYEAPKVAAAPPKKVVRKPQSTKYVVYFDFNSAKLSETGKTAIDYIKADVKDGAEVTLAAYTDRAGSTEYNNILASKRAKEVYSALESAGVKSEIGVAVFGEEQPSIETKDGVKERLNRRVEVTVTK